MAKKPNGTAKWVAIALVVVTNIVVIAYNTGVTHNHVKHLSEDVKELKLDVKTIEAYILEHGHE